MKVLLYADFRSSHARGWHQGLVAAGIDVTAVSSESVTDYEALSPQDRISIRREKFVRERASESSVTRTTRAGASLGSRVLSRVGQSQVFHTVIHLARSRYLRKRLADICEQVHPDLVHALRIPYEGVTVASLRTSVPRVISTWGSDFVPQAESDALLRAWTRRVMRSADGYQYDSRQDLARAIGLGLRSEVPTLHAAGNFGVDRAIFYVDKDRPQGVVVYPRRAKPNSNYQGFVEAASIISAKLGVRFVGVGLQAAKKELLELFGEDGVSAVELTGQLDREEMAALLRSADVVVSPTFWDGTPVSVLEAIACGSKVIAGRLPELELLQEAGLNIELIDAADTGAMVASIKHALSSTDRFGSASLPPAFDRDTNVSRVSQFYADIIGKFYVLNSRASGAVASG